MGVETFRKRPVEVQALRWMGDNRGEFDELLKGTGAWCYVAANGCLVLVLRDGARDVAPTQWVVREGDDVSRWAPDRFAAAYEPVEVPVTIPLEDFIAEHSAVDPEFRAGVEKAERELFERDRAAPAGVEG